MLKSIRNSTKFKKFHRGLKLYISEHLVNHSKNLPDGIDRVYHYHIRKSAGTSVNSAFWALGGYNLKSVGREPILIGKKCYVRYSAKLINEGYYFYASSHFPTWELDLRPNTFTFTILRDPYKRLVSLYKYYKWVEQVEDDHLGFLMDPSYYVLKKQTELLNKSFSDFIDVLSDKYLYGNLYMFSEILDVKEALKNLSQINKVYFQDQLAYATKDLSIVLNLPKLQLPTSQRKFNNTNYTISLEEKEKAISLLKREYEFYESAKTIYGVS
ncbi:sulfotransferase family 2 domain-containing protein [Winogradskyella undariae]|uniref:sulfotransferase family 2 domain-containing protein n=1 Tax=Winogradskyella undariae TaxID=1285465 RepID=UPI0015CAB5DC|nr:sulfotransferase family 2 domain-containing protein [Winogradskyella undariae]